MPIWKRKMDAAQAESVSRNTMFEHLGIEFMEIGEDYVKASMPVDHRTRQPLGLLHGGASVALAETVGSFAAHMVVDDGFICVGMEINSNHIRPVRQGRVIGVATPVHLGRSTQIWDIRISDEEGRLVNVSRLTMAILKAENGWENKTA